jgi:growth hormone-inducible transmembrane protein
MFNLKSLMAKHALVNSSMKAK